MTDNSILIDQSVNNDIKRFRKTPFNFIDDAVSVEDTGATGSGDDSEAIERAAYKASKKGGVVYFPPGIIRAQNITVYSNVRFVGQGWGATTVKLVDNATEPLFKYKTATDCQMAGWSHMSLEGIGTSGPDGIDMSAALSWQFAQNIGLKIWKFKKGIYGSKNDRRPFWKACQFWQNDYGYYVINNHPHFEMCDIRDNNYGISGLTLYDMQIDQSVFVRNNYGIVPDTGGTIQQTILTNVMLFGNYILGARVDRRVTFTGCYLVAGMGQDAASRGVEFLAGESAWIGGMVKGEGVTGFGDVAFYLGSIDDIAIQDVYIETDNFLTTSETSSSKRRYVISGNHGTVRGYFVRLVDTGVNGVQSSHVRDNNIVVPSTGGLLTTGDSLIYIPVTNSVAGNMVVNNTIHSLDSGYLAHAINADLRGSICSGNMMRNTQGVNVLNSDANTIYKGNRLPSGSQGVTWYASSSYDPPNIVSGTVVSTTVTVTGAALGDLVQASINKDPLGLQIWGAVTAANTVTVYFRNDTGADINISNGTVSVVVSKRW